MAQLGDLASVLAEIRRLPEVHEPRPAIFYVRRTPFLHFHWKDGRRWADVRAGGDWGKPIAIPPGAGFEARARFVRAVRRRHAQTLAAVAPRRRTAG